MGNVGKFLRWEVFEYLCKFSAEIVRKEGRERKERLLVMLCTIHTCPTLDRLNCGLSLFLDPPFYGVTYILVLSSFDDLTTEREGKGPRFFASICP